MVVEKVVKGIWRVIDMTIDEMALDEAILEFKERAEDIRIMSE